MVADFRSEQVADIILECMADFIGIRRNGRAAGFPVFAA
jgi:hypothetical protein